MNCKLTLTEKPSCLHIVVTGWNSGENVMQYLDEWLTRESNEST